MTSVDIFCSQVRANIRGEIKTESSVAVLGLIPKKSRGLVSCILVAAFGGQKQMQVSAFCCVDVKKGTRRAAPTILIPCTPCTSMALQT